MKNHSLLLLIVIIFSCADLSAQTTVVDSVVVKRCLYRPNEDPEYIATTIDSFSVDGSMVSSTQFDSLNSVMSIDNYSYSPSGKIVLHTRKDFLPGLNVDSTSHSYIYNTTDSLLTYTEMMYNSGSYLGGSRIVCLYDSINRTKLETSENCNSSGVWVLLSQVLYSFDSSDKLIRQENSDVVGGILTLRYSKGYEYLPNDSLDLYYFRDYSTMPQSDSVMYKYSYDSVGYLISIEKFSRDSANATFSIPLEYWAIYYDSTHTLIGKSSGWYLGIPGAPWELWDTTYYQYDASQRLIYQHQSLIPHCGNWNEYTYYTGTNNIDSVNYCRWCTHSGSCSFCKYEYFTLILNVAEHEPEHFLVFPNPAGSDINLILSGISNFGLAVVITDLQSKVVYTKTFFQSNGSLQLNNLELESGIYFMTVKTNKYTGTQKLIIAK